MQDHNNILSEAMKDVPDSMVPVMTPDEEAVKRLSTVHKSIKYLEDMVERVEMVERALGSVLPDVLKERPLGEAVDLVSALHDALKRLTGDDGVLAGVKKRVNYVKEVTMPERFDAEQVKTFNTDRWRVTKTTKLMASINGQAGVYPDGHEFAGQPLAYGWLRDHDYGSLIKPTVNASSLSAAAKELVENGMELPEEMFRVHTQISISITKKR
jgi:hypothetical protein